LAGAAGNAPGTESEGAAVGLAGMSMHMRISPVVARLALWLRG
jgi:hypothetical protein